MRSFESLPKDEQIDTLIVLMNYLARMNCVSLDQVAAVERRTARDVWVSILKKLNLPETTIPLRILTH